MTSGGASKKTKCSIFSIKPNSSLVASSFFKFSKHSEKPNGGMGAAPMGAGAGAPLGGATPPSGLGGGPPPGLGTDTTGLGGAPPTGQEDIELLDDIDVFNALEKYFHHVEKKQKK